MLLSLAFILLLYVKCLFNLLFRGLLRLLLKSVCQDYQVPFIEKAEDAVDIASMLYADLVKAFRIFEVFEVRFGNPLDFFNQFKSPNNFLLDLILLPYKELLEVALVENYSPVLTGLLHSSKLGNVAR